MKQIREPDMTDAESARHTLIMKNLTDDADNQRDQRENANEDMRFVNVDGGMWEDARLDSAYAERAKMEFDLVSNYLWRFIGEWNQNRQGVEYRPDNDATQDNDAKLMSGIYRADFRDGSGKIALDNAVYETSTCGVGALKLATKFEDESDPENMNQRIEWRDIVNAYNNVHWDYTSQRLDKRNARWVTELTEYSEDSFLEAWPGKLPVSAYDPETLMDNIDSTNRVQERIRIATRYEIKKKKESIFIYNNLQTGKVEVYSKEQHEEVRASLENDETMQFEQERKIIKQTVQKEVFSGAGILEKAKTIAGKYLPIIPFYGYRMFVDGQEWFHGLPRKLKDAARLFNMHMNQLAENAASNGQNVPIFDPKQMPEGVSDTWADRNNVPYLLAKSLVDPATGQLVHHGPTGYLQPNQLDGSTAASIQAVTEFIREFTGGVPQDTLDPNASGKAIRAIIKRMNLNTQPVQDNINTAIEWMGWVYQSMASEVYTRQSIVRTLGLDGTEARVNLMETKVNEETGEFIESNNLRGKKFRAYVDVGPQYESLREESVENIKGLGDFLRDSPNGQQYLPAVMAVLLENMEGVGLEPIKEMNRKNMLLMGLKKPETDEDKAFLAQATQPKPDPSKNLMEGLAEEAMAKARKSDSESAKNVAQTNKVVAETKKILSEIGQGEAKTLQELRNEAFKQAEGLPFGPN